MPVVQVHDQRTQGKHVGQVALHGHHVLFQKDFFLPGRFLPLVFFAPLPLGFFFAFFFASGLPFFLPFDLPDDGWVEAPARQGQRSAQSKAGSRLRPETGFWGRRARAVEVNQGRGDEQQARYTPTMPISLAYSVDADDAFMFYALLAGGVVTRGLEFTHHRGDTSELNALAQAAKLTWWRSRQAPIRGVGQVFDPAARCFGGARLRPVLVARQPMALADLAGRRIGIPGLSTTAWLVLRQMQRAGARDRAYAPLGESSSVWMPAPSTQPC